MVLAECLTFFFSKKVRVKMLFRALLRASRPELNVRAGIVIRFRRDIIRFPITDLRFDAIIPIAAGKQENGRHHFTHFNLSLCFIFLFINFFLYAMSSYNSYLV